MQQPSIQPPVRIIEPSKTLFRLDITEMWAFRDLFYFLMWRDIKVRYKQTVIGVTWAILQPLLTATIFTIIFGYFVQIPSDGVPYPIFAYAALLPWNYFSQAVERSSNSLIEQEKLVTKVYFPRLLVPLSSVATPIVDTALAFVVMIGMMIFFHTPITPRILLLPAFLLLAFVSALAVSLWLSALNVQYRDVRYAIPFVLQIWMYASPIVYPVSVFPEKLRILASLNPMTAVITGFRWVVVGAAPPSAAAIALSVGIILMLLFGGLIYFRRMETVFADII